MQYYSYSEKLFRESFQICQLRRGIFEHLRLLLQLAPHVGNFRVCFDSNLLRCLLNYVVQFYRNYRMFAITVRVSDYDIIIVI